jgi:hypothetical protein
VIESGGERKNNDYEQVEKKSDRKRERDKGEKKEVRQIDRDKVENYCAKKRII